MVERVFQQPASPFFEILVVAEQELCLELLPGKICLLCDSIIARRSCRFMVT